MRILAPAACPTKKVCLLFANTHRSAAFVICLLARDSISYHTTFYIPFLHRVRYPPGLQLLSPWHAECRCPRPAPPSLALLLGVLVTHQMHPPLQTPDSLAEAIARGLYDSLPQLLLLLLLTMAKTPVAKC